MALEGIITTTTEGGITETRYAEDWVVIAYGIPGQSTNIRDKLRKALKRHGLWSIDLGGSVYAGPRTQALDERLVTIIRDLQKKHGIAQLVRVLPGGATSEQAKSMRDAVVESIMADMELIRLSMEELEKAMVGEIVLVNEKDGKERNLLTTGYGRINSAENLMAGMEAAILRFATSKTAEVEVEQIRFRIKTVAAYVGKIKIHFDDFAVNERARQKATGNASLEVA